MSAYTVPGCSECEARIGSHRRKGVGGKAGDLANCDMLDSMDRWALSIYGWLARSHGARHRFGTTGAVAGLPLGDQIILNSNQRSNSINDSDENVRTYRRTYRCKCKRNIGHTHGLSGGLQDGSILSTKDKAVVHNMY